MTISKTTGICVFGLLLSFTAISPTSHAAEVPTSDLDTADPAQERIDAEDDAWRDEMVLQVRKIRLGWIAPLAVGECVGLAALIPGIWMLSTHELAAFGNLLLVPIGSMTMGITLAMFTAALISTAGAKHMASRGFSVSRVSRDLKRSEIGFGIASGVFAFLTPIAFMVLAGTGYADLLWVGLGTLGVSMTLASISVTSLILSDHLPTSSSRASLGGHVPRIVFVSPTGIAGVW